MVAANSSVLPVLQSLPTGSSGTGISYYSTAAKCARRARLDKERAESSFSSDLRMDTGKIFHALCEIYFSTGQQNIAVELGDVNYGEAPDEARRLFAAYAERFFPEDFSRVVATELLLPPEGDSVAAAKIAEAIGVSPFTCRIDMVVEVDERSAEVLNKKRKLTLEPGVYLWDFKTKGARDNNAELVYRHAPQFIAYQVAWNALNPSNPCKGMVADVIISHKKMEDDKSFYSVFVPPPQEIQVRGLRRFLQSAQANAPTDNPNWLACFDFNKACSHLVSGACDRA
jgi:hypothetical protein